MLQVVLWFPGAQSLTHLRGALLPRTHHCAQGKLGHLYITTPPGADLCAPDGQDKSSSVFLHPGDPCRPNPRGGKFGEFSKLWRATWVFKAAANLFQHKLKVTKLCHFFLCVKELQKAILSSHFFNKESFLFFTSKLSIQKRLVINGLIYGKFLD